MSRHLFLSTSEAGTLLGLTSTSVVQLIEHGKLTAFYDEPSGQWQVDREALEESVLRFKTQHLMHASEDDLLA